MTGQLALAALLATGCGSTCADSLAKLEANRQATIAHRCRKYPSVYDCPRTDGIDWKYRRRVEVVAQRCEVAR